jgi:NitT/TauT family transport system substrate-binding protein
MDKDAKIIVAVLVAVVVIVAAVSATFLMFRNEGGTVLYITKAPADMRGALAAGQIDGYIAWEPFVSDSVVGGVGEVLMWSDEIMPNHPCCVVAASNDFLQGPNGVELTERFLKAHIEANQWMADALADPNGDNYTLLVNIATQFTARNASVVEAAFEHIKYGYEMNDDFRSALEQFTDMYIDTNMTTPAKLTLRGYSSVDDFIQNYVNSTYLAAAVTIAPSSTILNPDDPIRVGFLLGDLHQLAKAVAENKNILGTGKSMYEEYGLNVVNASGAPFANGGAEMLGFAAGNIDMGYLGAPPALLQHLNAGTQTTIVAQANSEGSGIVVKTGSGIHSLSDLVNKTVATPGESSIQFLLLKIALDREGLDLEIKA